MSDVIISASMVGVEKINSLVSDLGNVDRNKAIRFGLLSGAKVIERIGRRNLRLRNDEHTGNLTKSLRAKISRRELNAYAGFERSYRFELEKGVGNHAHLVDRGTAERYTKKGHYRGIMPASYFWTDAKTQSESAVRQKILSGVEMMVQRLKNKYAQ